MADNGYDGLVIGIIGVLFSAVFSLFLGWLDSWIFFGILVVGGLMLINNNHNMFPAVIVGMLSGGIFTKLGYIPFLLYISFFIVASLFLSAQIVGRYMNLGTSGAEGGNK